VSDPVPDCGARGLPAYIERQMHGHAQRLAFRMQSGEVLTLAEFDLVAAMQLVDELRAKLDELAPER
jgi:hypothetical protein